MHANPLQLTEEEMRLQAAHDVLCNEDLLKRLFEKLGREGLCSAGATCRQWRQVAESDEFWTSLDFSGLSISPWQVMCTTGLPVLRNQGYDTAVLGSGLAVSSNWAISSNQHLFNVCRWCPSYSAILTYMS